MVSDSGHILASDKERFVVAVDLHVFHSSL
jgi:hypothetical protein